MDTHKFAALSVVATVVLVVVLFVVFSITRPSIESFPLDWGWLGFVFIFINGFLLSFGLINKEVGVLERLLLTIGLGFGVTFMVMIVVGVLWQITLTTILLSQLILLSFFGGVALRRGLRLPHFDLEPKNLQLTKQHLLQIVLIAIIGVLAFAALYAALSLPPTEWDSLAYGVNYAKIIFQDRHIPLIAGPSIGIEMSASYPPGMQLTATFLYGFAGNANDFYYRLLSPIFSIATLLVVYKFAQQITKTRTASVFAVSALTLTPFFWELFIQETYLMALTFMLTMSAYFFYKAYITKTGDPQNYEVLGSLFCGFTALTSYIGLFGLGVPLLYALHKRLGLKRFAGLVSVALLVVFPWYLRNLVLLGSPVYPFAGIGKYLDPLLHSSTSLHFRNYLLLPLYAWTSTACKVGVVLLIVGVVFFTLSKRRKDFPLALTLCLLLVSISLMAFYVAFPRYLAIALPMSAVFFGFAINALPKKRRLSQIGSAVFIALVVIGSAVMFPYINSVKPSAAAGESREQYISSIYQEGNAWQWINQNTPANTKIASYDIKEYYLNRMLFPLDGGEAAPLYYMDSIQEALQFLTDNGVGYVLSAPWASPMDERLPPAYTWCIITRYLGDVDYLPPVFVDANGTAVYHVGTLNYTDINQGFAEKGMVAPLRHQTVNLTIPNTTDIHVAACNISFPVDYRNGSITVSVVSVNSTNLDLQLWNEIIPPDQIQKPVTAFPDGNYQIANSDFESSFTWHIDQAGYFTIRVLYPDKIMSEPLGITLDILFYGRGM
jgi:hypothetical protein